MNLFQVIEMLDRGAIDYVLVGGLAVALHGYQRMTMDVDIVLAMSPDNLGRFIDCARAAGLQPVIPVSIEALADPALIDRWYREKGMLAFGLRASDLMAPVAARMQSISTSLKRFKREARHDR